MQIYGVTVNTATERIIHSGAYLRPMRAYTRLHSTGGTVVDALGYPGICPVWHARVYACARDTRPRAALSVSTDRVREGEGASASANIKRLIYYVLRALRRLEFLRHSGMSASHFAPLFSIRLR